MDIEGFSWVGIRTDDFEATVRFFEEKVGLTLDWHSVQPEIAHFRLPSGQLFEVFGPNDAGVHTTNCPVVGFDVADVQMAREGLTERGVEFVTEVEEGEDGASWVYFRSPDGQLYQLQRPSQH